MCWGFMEATQLQHEWYLQGTEAFLHWKRAPMASLWPSRREPVSRMEGLGRVRLYFTCRLPPDEVGLAITRDTLWSGMSSTKQAYIWSALEFRRTRDDSGRVWSGNTSQRRRKLHGNMKDE